MNRLTKWCLGVGLGLAPLPALAQDLKTIPPAAPGAQVPMATPLSSLGQGNPAAPTQARPGTPIDISQPLPNVLSQSFSTAPTVAAPCSTPAGACAPAASVGVGGLAHHNGDLLGKIKRWFCFQPGPAVLPNCVPNRYHAPVQAFFPCNPNAGGCGAGGCGTNGCGPNGAMAGPCGPCGPMGGAAGFGAMNGASPGLGSRVAGLIGGGRGACGNGSCGDGYEACAAPKHKGLGVCSTPSNDAPVTGPIGYGVAAVPVPLPAACVGSSGGQPACSSPTGENLLERMRRGLFLGGCGSCGAHASNWSNAAANSYGPPPTATVPVVMGYTQPAPGYRFANPLGTPTPQQGQPTQPAVGQPQQQGVTPASAARPFSNP